MGGGGERGRGPGQLRGSSDSNDRPAPVAKKPALPNSKQSRLLFSEGATVLSVRPLIRATTSLSASAWDARWGRRTSEEGLSGWNPLPLPLPPALPSPPLPPPRLPGPSPGRHVDCQAMEEDGVRSNPMDCTRERGVSAEPEDGHCSADTARRHLEEELSTLKVELRALQELTARKDKAQCAAQEKEDTPCELQVPAFTASTCTSHGDEGHPKAQCNAGGASWGSFHDLGPIICLSWGFPRGGGGVWVRGCDGRKEGLPFLDLHLKSPRRDVVRSSPDADTVQPPCGHSRSIPQGMILDV